jgi:hypothetical protein
VRQLMEFLRRDPRQYPAQAQRIRQQVQEFERRNQEQWRRMQEREDARREAKRIFEGVDEFFEDEPSPDLMEI